VRAYPKPEKAGLDFDGQGTISAANPDRPEATYLLELQRRMTRVALEESIILVGSARTF